MTNRLLILDTASLYYRAFYGLPDSLRAPDGTIVNAVRGTIDFLSLLVEEYRPTAVIAAWDHDWRPAWRVMLLDSYKTHRLAPGSDTDEDTPEELVPQIRLISQALDMLHIPVMGFAEAEADDVIGSVCQQWPGPVDIATGDRDLFQLVTERRRVLYTARGVKAHQIVDEASVRAEYGIEPWQYVDFAVLRGDPSDGIAGVRGIGAKTAARLLGQFSDLAGIIEAAADDDSDLSPAIRRNLLAAGSYLDAAAKVIRVRDDLPIGRIDARKPLDARDRADFDEFGRAWGLGSVASRALTAMSGHS